MALGFMLVFLLLLLLRMRTALNEKRARAWSLYRRSAARGEDSAPPLPDAPGIAVKP
jgi:hypothetical protein